MIGNAWLQLKGFIALTSFEYQFVQVSHHWFMFHQSNKISNFHPLNCPLLQEKEHMKGHHRAGAAGGAGGGGGGGGGQLSSVGGGPLGSEPASPDSPGNKKCDSKTSSSAPGRLSYINISHMIIIQNKAVLIFKFEEFWFRIFLFIFIHFYSFFSFYSFYSWFRSVQLSQAEGGARRRRLWCWAGCPETRGHEWSWPPQSQVQTSYDTDQSHLMTNHK